MRDTIVAGAESVLRARRGAVLTARADQSIEEPDHDERTSAAPTILIVPGLRDHVPAHWQTLPRAEAREREVRAADGADQDKLSCAAWVAELDKSLAAIAGPVILVAHSAGVMIVVHWAQRHRRPIVGALLAAPPDFESPLPEGYPTQQVLRDNGWLPTPRAALPFPTIVACEHQRSARAVTSASRRSRGPGAARSSMLGNVGHLNPASGYGEWPQAEEFIRELAHTSTSPR